MLNYAENMLKLKGLHYPVQRRKKKHRNQIKNKNFLVSGEAPDQRMPPPHHFLPVEALS